jgi:hypothetical protein
MAGKATNDRYANNQRALYIKLDGIPEISAILKVVAQSKSLDIIFDFNKESIIDLDPTSSSATSGQTDFRSCRIYIGAKQPTKKVTYWAP